MKTTDLHFQHILNAEPGRVFAALTESTQVNQWFSEHADVDVEGNLELVNAYLDEALPCGRPDLWPETKVVWHSPIDHTWVQNVLATNERLRSD